MELTRIPAYNLPYFTVGGLARFLRLDLQSILSLVKKGDLPRADRVDGDLRSGKREIRQWLRERG